MATPQQLMDGAACYDCVVPPGFRAAAINYLLGRSLGVTDPQALLDAAKCFECKIPPGAQQAVMLYLLAQMAGQTDVQAMMNNARCFDCIPDGMKPSVMIYLTDQLT